MLIMQQNSKQYVLRSINTDADKMLYKVTALPWMVAAKCMVGSILTAAMKKI